MHEFNKFRTFIKNKKHLDLSVKLSIAVFKKNILYVIVNSPSTFLFMGKPRL